MLRHFIHDVLVQFDASSGVRHEDDTLLQLDTAGRLDVRTELSRKGSVGSPSDSVAVENDELLVCVSLHGGVPQTTGLLQGVEVFSVAVVVGADEHDGVKVRRSTGLERELGVETDGSRGNGTLGRADDHDDDTLGEQSGLDLGHDGGAESRKQEQADLSSSRSEDLTLAGDLRQVLGLSAVVGRDLIGNGEASEVRGDLDCKVVVDDVESLDHSLLDNLFVALAELEGCGALMRRQLSALVKRNQ
jgi:hypothetical protein